MEYDWRSLDEGVSTSLFARSSSLINSSLSMTRHDSVVGNSSALNELGRSNGKDASKSGVLSFEFAAAFAFTSGSGEFVPKCLAACRARRSSISVRGRGGIPISNKSRDAQVLPKRT